MKQVEERYISFEASKMAYRDIKNSVDTAKREGIAEGMEKGMEYSMSSFKSLMTNIYLVKRIFKASGYTPNRTLISKIFKGKKVKR